MNPVINPWLFYWLNTYYVVDMILKAVALIGGATAFIITVTSYVDESIWVNERFKRIRRKAIITFSIIVTLAVFLPTKKTIIQMYITQHLTQDKICSVHQTVKKDIINIINQIGEKKK